MIVQDGGQKVLRVEQWHTMQISVDGQKLEGYLNGKLLLQYDLPEPVAGKVGVWSKTDSVSYFDDFTVVSGGLQK